MAGGVSLVDAIMKVWECECEWGLKKEQQGRPANGVY